MLEEFVKDGPANLPRFKLCFIDEAQDLTPLQWEVVRNIAEVSDKIYVAGDDDQAIYRWNGADVETFINLEGGTEILDQSYRIPSSVHELASKVSSRINKRMPKEYKPRDERGSVTYANSINDIDMSDGSWLIMGSADYMLGPIKEDLKSNGFLFRSGDVRSISEKISDAVNGWEQLRKKQVIYGSTARNIYSFMASGKRVARGYKKLNGLEDADMVCLNDLIENFGLLANDQMIWSEAMDKIPDKERAYITALLRKGQKFNGEPRMNVSTIHGAKGGEADNVVLLTDLSHAADTSMRRNPDDLHRVFYVGVTRSKKNLFIINPENYDRCYPL